MPGVLAANNIAGRLAMDVFMGVPIVHLLSRLPDRVFLRLMPLYDGWCRALYRLLLRIVVKDPVTRTALLPHYGIMAKRPPISSSFLPALNNPNTHLITTPIERITRTGVRTADGVDRPADLLVLATGYELWTDPETYRVATILGTGGFDLAEYYHSGGLRSYAGTAHPRLPNRWEIAGPFGFVGFAWMDFVETIGARRSRDRRSPPSRRRHLAVSQDASTGGTPRCVAAVRPRTFTISPMTASTATTSTLRVKRCTTGPRPSPRRGCSPAVRRCRTTSSPQLSPTPRCPPRSDPRDVNRSTGWDASANMALHFARSAFAASVPVPSSLRALTSFNCSFRAVKFC